MFHVIHFLHTYFLLFLANIYHLNQDTSQNFFRYLQSVFASDWSVRTMLSFALSDSNFIEYHIWMRYTLNFLYWISGLCTSFGILRRTHRFRNWICLRPQMKTWGVPTQLVPLERANLSL